MEGRANVALLLAVAVLGCDSNRTGELGATGAAGRGGVGDGGTAGTGGIGGSGTAGAGGIGGSATGGAVGGGAAGGNNDASIDAPTTPTDAACLPVEQAVLGSHPEILVLLDASGSMDNDIEENNCDQGCGAKSKWALTVAAVNQVVSATSVNVSWGLKFFADKDAMCTVSAGVSVPIGQGNAAAIATAIVGRSSANGGVANGGATPTRAAVTAAAAYLATINDGNPKFLLLATDGQPNCPASGAAESDDSAAAIQAVSSTFQAGVPTFVVGIGTLSSTEIVLNSLAQAGGHPRAVTPAYYPASSTADLVTALNQLVGIARTCTLLVAPPPGKSRDAIDVLADGTAIPHDPTHVNGWDYSDPRHTGIDLYGAACTSAIMGATLHLSILFQCPPDG
jgi:hypothetical protein